jgi:Flp pilus assembly protein TadD
MYANEMKYRSARPNDSVMQLYSLRASPKAARRNVSYMKKSFFCVLLLVGTLSAICQPAPAQVKVWQGTLTLPTYEEGLPDPNPPFDTYQTTRFNYPYTLRTNLTGVKADHAWRAIFLENEYLKCTVLPDIGGHLYTCVDKISGQPMFYANPSIKKANIGYRGAWAAFGVEFNFPVSHNWVSMSPVDFAYAAHEDRSASVWVGNIDRPYGMQWGVELVLKPGSTLLEERVTLYNRSDVRHRYYWWNNAGLQVWDDSRIEYPMRFTASHGFVDVSPWPIDPEGKDLSVIGNQTDGPVSRFMYGSYEPFMGIWNPKTQAGTVHFAEYRDLPGKKIWTWGVDAAGLDWRTALSDNQSAYAEVQAGLFRNQETYAFLDPGQTIRFSEYWMPVRGTGGISRANKAGVVHFDAYGSDVSVALNVNERLQGAQVSLTQNGAVLWSGTADLAPEKTWSHSVSSKGESGKVTFELKDRAGHSLLKQTDGEYDWDPEATIKTGPQQALRIPEPANRSEDDWLQVGQDQELNGEVVLALASYESALEKYPRSQSLELAAGRLAASLQRFEEAERLLQLAQQRDTPDSEIAYYLGIAEEGLGHTREAETSYEIAYRQAGLRGPAAIRLGELRARQEDLRGAASFLNAAVAADPANPRAQEELEAVLRALGERSEADRLANLGLGMDPMSDFLKEDTGKPDQKHLAADPYRVLRVAAEYLQLGLYRKALEVLDRTYQPVDADQSEPGSVLPQKHPLVFYYAAYCKQKLGADAQRNWQAASELSPSLVFPSSQTDRVVLEAALAANGSDATAHYLLGTLLFSKGLSDAGMAHWAQAKQFAPHLQEVDVDMGDALLKLKGDPQRALASFREGMRNDPDNAEVYVGLDEAMSLTGASAAERAAVLSQYPSADAPDSKMPADLVYQLALTRAEAMQYEQALALFKGRFFPSEEGGITPGQVLFEIGLLQAEAWAKARNCAQADDFLAGKQPGMSLDGRSARDDVKLAGIARGCGHAKESEDLLHKAAAGVDSADLVWAIQAEKSLRTYDAGKADQRVAKSLAAAESRAETGANSGSWWYNIGLLQTALNRKQQARESVEKALILPDTHMSHHLAREALAELSAGK